jgi:hypothetical protein
MAGVRTGDDAKVNEDKTCSVSANAGFDFLGVHSVSSKRHAAGGEARSAQRTLGIPPVQPDRNLLQQNSRDLFCRRDATKNC